MKQKAFTLTELLIIVAIVSILATLIYPSFEGFTTRSRLQEVYDTVELIRAAEMNYYFKNSIYYEFQYGGTGSGGTGSPASYENAEASLSIALPRHTTLLVYAAIHHPVSGNFTIVAASPDFSGPYYYDMTNNTSSLNKNHPYAKYLHADVEFQS